MGLLFQPGGGSGSENQNSLGLLVEETSSEPIESMKLFGNNIEEATLSFAEILLDIVPSNIFSAMAEGKALSVLIFALFFGSALQQVALLYTDVANSAVFTVLYVVIVPVLAYFLFSKKIHKSVWPAVIMCLLGGLFLSELNNYRVRLGDSLVVIGAFFWALHIVFVSKFLKIFNYPITIAAFQCLIAAMFSAVPAISIEFISFKLLSLEAGELLYAGVLSSGLAFLLQIIALQHLSPAPAAIIFSLEGVFASVAAWILLDQYLNEFKILGIIIILSAVIFSQLAPIYGNKIYGRN